MLRVIDPKDFLEIEKIHTELRPTNWSVQALKDELKQVYSNSFLFQGQDGEILGFILVRLLATDCEITSLAVKEKARRKGIGKGLIEEAVKKLKPERVLLEVSTNNRGAISLYKNYGFKQGRIRKAYYSDGSDAQEMFLEIV